MTIMLYDTNIISDFAMILMPYDADNIQIIATILRCRYLNEQLDHIPSSSII